MSIDTAESVDSVPPHFRPNHAESPPEPWQSSQEKILQRAKQTSAKMVFGKATKNGECYRWGVAVAGGTACSELTEVLSRLACQQPLTKRQSRFDLESAAQRFIETLGDRPNKLTALQAAEAIMWASAIPALLKGSKSSSSSWSSLGWQMLTALVRLRETVLQQSQPYRPAHLMICGELGLTLAWRFADLPSCRSLQTSAVDAVGAWCEQETESVPAVLTSATDARVVLASLVRCRHLIEQTSKRKFRKRCVRAGEVLAGWVAAMTTRDGGSAFSSAKGKDVKVDVAPSGLLRQAAQFDTESLQPAIEAALGAHPTGGRLAWEVCLPSSMWHDPNSKLAILLPEWDVRRSRTHVDYSGENVCIEIFSGRERVIAGQWQTMIEIDGVEQQPCGDWTEICEYDDDDVHYLEIEQPWTGGLLIHRQIMQIREDQCLLLADAIVPDNSGGDDAEGSDVEKADDSDMQRRIRYSSRLPIASGIETDPEPETREVFLSNGRRRTMVIPLSAGEWRVGATHATLKETEDDRHLLFASEGNRSHYAPLWLDFCSRRFKRLRTWRRLTVGDELRLCRPNEAVGFRIQAGSEQWMIYRSLGQRRCRSLLGKHLVADFYASRFDMGEGYHDALVTVDDHDHDGA